MEFAKSVKSFFSRVSPFYLFLIAISPLLLSALIHLSILIYANFVKWTWFGKRPEVEAPLPVTILGEGRKEAGLKFFGTDLKDDFDADDDMFDPVPEIEYRPVIPDVEILPDFKADELDILSVQAAAVNSKWVNPATGGKPLDTGSGMMVMGGSFSRHIQSIREGGLDVVFVFDSTSSMGGYLKSVKLKIENLATQFKKLVPSCRIGLVTYRDIKDEHVTQQVPLTYGIQSLHRFLSGIKAVGGYGIREAVAEGLRVAIEKMKWNEKSRKFILLIGDAPPYQSDIDRAIGMIKHFKKKMGGKLSSIDVRKPKRTMTRELWQDNILPRMTDPGIESYEYLTDPHMVMEDFETFARVGGGESARLINEEKVIQHMLLMIFGTRWEMYLDEFMRNL